MPSRCAGSRHARGRRRRTGLRACNRGTGAIRCETVLAIAWQEMDYLCRFLPFYGCRVQPRMGCFITRIATMKITQLRNATAIVELGSHRILIDPMLAPRGTLPPLKLLAGRVRNPVADLPPMTDSLLDTVTHCLITHCQKGHFDHLDRAGKHWLRAAQVPVIC